MPDHLAFLDAVLTEAARTARAMAGRDPGRATSADRNQVVTEADVRIGERLVDNVRSAFPADSVIEEESGLVPGTSDHTWVIDPIDGTSNYAAGSPHYAVMVGLLRGGTPVAAGIALPAFHEVFLARAGNGLHRNGTRVPAAEHTPLASSLIAYGLDIHSPEQCARECETLAEVAANCRGVRSSNSAYDLILTATGVYGGCFGRSNRIWDCVAPHVVVGESGGIVSSLTGVPLDFGEPGSRVHETFTMLACRAELHDDLVRIVAEADGRHASVTTPGGTAWTPGTWKPSSPSST